MTFNEYHPDGTRMAAQSVTLTAQSELLLVGLADAGFMNVVLDGIYYCLLETDFDRMEMAIKNLADKG